MQCPRCETKALDERDREGVTIDVCRNCRGVWLDRGELEKLIARTTAEFDEVERAPPESKSQNKQYRDEDAYRPKPHRKKSWMESLGDIFD